MTTALLDAITETPNDDGPRLVYADWLQQQDAEAARARGEYIALACSTARSTRRTARLEELLARHATEWLGPLAAITDPRQRQWSRGFLEAAALVRRGDRPSTIDAALGHPAWRTLRVLDASATVIPDVERLVCQPACVNLRALYVSQLWVEWIAKSPDAPRLAELAIAPAGMSLSSVFPMLWWAGLSQLRRLHLFGCSPAHLPELERPDLALIVVAAPNALASWLGELERTRSPLAEVRLVSTIHPLLARRGVELVIRPDDEQWSALEIRWTEDNEPKLRDAVIHNLERLPENVLTRASFVGPTTARFDVARWRHRVTNALLQRQAGIHWSS